MELKGERLIPASVERTWAALNDPEVLRTCVSGCDSLERTGDDSYQAQMAVKIGPVSARFKGSLKMTDVNPPTSYTIHFEGQGGVAGHGKGSADVSLAPAEGGQTLLNYVARAQVGGKIAQIGSRLVDAAAAKISEEFFQAFEDKLRAEAAAAAPVVTETAAEPTEAPPAAATGAAESVVSQAEAVAAPAPATAPASPPAAAQVPAVVPVVAARAPAPAPTPAPGSSKLAWWLAGIGWALLAICYFSH